MWKCTILTRAKYKIKGYAANMKGYKWCPDRILQQPYETLCLVCPGYNIELTTSYNDLTASYNGLTEPYNGLTEPYNYLTTSYNNLTTSYN